MLVVPDGLVFVDDRKGAAVLAERGLEECKLRERRASMRWDRKANVSGLQQLMPMLKVVGM